MIVCMERTTNLDATLPFTTCSSTINSINIANNFGSISMDNATPGMKLFD